MEVWKDIPNYEGIYQASNTGFIRSVEGKTTYSKLHGERHWKSRILKGRGDSIKTGKRVQLWKDGKSKDWLVARLVAITFIGFPPKGFTVNHKDGNRLNNNIENLEWCSLEDNIKHGFITGLYHSVQRNVTITKDGESYSFASCSEADKFLGRARGYTSNAICRGRKLTDKNGNVYDATLLETRC